jgi:hypothetical protein
MLKFGLLETSEFSFQPSFFAKSPFRRHVFVGDTVLLILTLSILGFVIVRYWSRLSAISVYWLGLVTFCMVALWVLALRCYRRIHEVFRDGDACSVSDDSLLGVAMSSAAGMIHWGLFFAYFMTAGLLMQLAWVLSGR